MAKDSSLLLLYLRFDPWPRNFCMLGAANEKKKKKEKENHLGEMRRIDWGRSGPGGYLFIYLLFRATPTAYGGSQARDQIKAAAARLHHSHSNTRSLTH